MLYSRINPESYITEHTLVYEDQSAFLRTRHDTNTTCNRGSKKRAFWRNRAIFGTWHQTTREIKDVTMKHTRFRALTETKVESWDVSKQKWNLR